MGCTTSDSINKQDNPRTNKNRHSRTLSINPKKQSMKISDVIVQNIIVNQMKITPQQINFAVKCFSQLDFFNSLSNQQLTILCKLLISAQTAQQEYVFRQGDDGHCFFLIEKGQIQIQVDGIPINTLSSGQVFGELALILKTKRSASIKAKSNCKFLVMKPLTFKQTIQQIKTSEYQAKRNSINKIQIFQGLTNKQKLNLANALKIITFQKGRKIVAKNDIANAFYIIVEGKVFVQLENDKNIYLGKNQYFGQSAFQNQGRRKFSVVAAQKTVCSIISKDDFQKHSQTKAQSVYFYSMKKWALQRSEVFRKYNKSTLNAINLSFQTVQAKDKTKILKNGIVICLQGKINGFKQGQQVFGQKQWVQNAKTFPQLIKQEDGFYAFLDVKKLNQVFANIKQKKQVLNLIQNITNSSNKQNQGFIDLSSFQYLKDLGEGQFGTVKLIKDKNFSRLYALKQIPKAMIKQDGLQNQIQEERQILLKTQYPYIVGFVQAFTDLNNLYFLMQYIKGVQMFSVIREINKIDFHIARYFFACLLSSIEHLHSKNIIYRDVKPENSVIDYTGKAYLIDMGTARFLKKQRLFRTYTIIGTPHYMAPQVFMNQGYSYQADIWSLGVVLYQFLCNRLPFAENQLDTFKVMSSIRKDKIIYPKCLDPSAQQLLKLILNKNSQQRAVTASIEKIKNSDFFSGFNWQDFLMQKMAPPYIPKSFRNTKPRDTLKMYGKPLVKHLYPKAFDLGHYVQFKQWNDQINF